MLSTVVVRPGRVRGRAGFVVFEGEGVEPFFPARRQAFGYAIERVGGGHRALEVHDAEGAVLRRLEPAEAGALAHRTAMSRPFPSAQPEH